MPELELSYQRVTACMKATQGRDRQRRGYNGAMVVALTEIVPVAVRTVGFALAYSLATALFGGFTPAVSTYLIEATGNKAAPGLWMSFAAVCSLVATMLIYRRGPARAAAAHVGHP